MPQCEKCGAFVGELEEKCPSCHTPLTDAAQPAEGGYRTRKFEMHGLPPETRDVLKEAASALYFAYENPSPAMNAASYETLYHKVVDLARRLGCDIE